MITYESLKELAYALSKITGYHYVAFCESYEDTLSVKLSDSEMIWHLAKMSPFGCWVYGVHMHNIVLTVKNLPKLDWSKCQFNCKEAKNDR